MNSAISRNLISQKSFEISYALIRLSQVTPSENFKVYLEHYALELLAAASLEDYPKTGKVLRAVDYTARLGVEAGYVGPGNGELLIRESQGLHAAIAELDNAAKVADIDLDKVFSKESQARKPEHEAKPKVNSKKNVPKYEEAKEVSRSQEPGDYDLALPDSPATFAAYAAKNRQSVILDIIRQNNTCRFKDILEDIQEFFPDVSERTIRYDLEKLMEQGLIERIGSGGPSGFYRLKGEKVEAYVPGDVEAREVSEI